MDIKRIQCPACHSNRFIHDDAGNMICEACGTKYASPRKEIGCRACGTLNPAGTRYCNQCGLQLGRTCTACDYDNPAGVDVCDNCGTPLDIISALTDRQQQQTFGNVARRTEKFVQSTAQDMEFMARERQRIDEEERARRAQLAARKAAARQQQQRMLIVVLIAVGVFIITGVIVALLLAAGG